MKIYVAFVLACLICSPAKAGDQVLKLICQSEVNDELLFFEQASISNYDGKQLLERALSNGGAPSEIFAAYACVDSINIEAIRKADNIFFEDYLNNNQSICVSSDTETRSQFGNMWFRFIDSKELTQVFRVSLNKTPVRAYSRSPSGPEGSHGSLRRDYVCSENPIFAPPTILAD